MSVSRRDALKRLAMGAGAVAGSAMLPEAAWAQALAVRARAAADNVSGLQFFTPEQHETVNVLSELIIPADERSPGARAAKVADFIDLVLSGALDEDQALWREGLAALDAEAVARWERPFAALEQRDQVTLLTEISAREHEPLTALERFFVAAKARTVQGYYTSEIGIHQELGYQGNEFLKEFVGCTHPEHM